MATTLTKDDLKQIKALFKEDFERIDQRFDQVDARLDNLEKRLVKVENRLVKLEKRLDKVEKRLDKVEKRLDKVEKRLDKIEERLDEVERRLDKVEKRLDKVEKRLDKVEKRLDKVEIRLDKVEDRLDRMEEEMSDLKKAIRQVYTDTVELLQSTFPTKDDVMTKEHYEELKFEIRELRDYIDSKDEFNQRQFSDIRERLSRNEKFIRLMRTAYGIVSDKKNTYNASSNEED